MMCLKAEQSQEQPFKHLTAQGIEVIKNKGQPVTPGHLFSAILALLSVLLADSAWVY